MSHVIRMLNMSNGETRLIAGSGAQGYQEGVGSSALFNMPSGVALTPDDEYAFIADTGYLPPNAYPILLEFEYLETCMDIRRFQVGVGLIDKFGVCLSFYPPREQRRPSD